MIAEVEDQLPIPRHSVASLVATYHDAVAKIREACASIAEQHERIQAAFGNDAHVKLETRNLRFDDPSDQIIDMNRWAWRSIVNVSGVRRVLSVKAANELDKQLNESVLPPITEQSVEGFLAHHRAKAGDHLADAVREVHDMLRPPQSRFKTNTEFDIGSRVILTWWVSPGYGRGRPFIPHYRRSAEFRALDNVFLLLDGKPGIGTHNGTLADAIAASEDGTGETPYFRFKACKNQNLHLEFIRPDLVAKLNAIAGGRNLYAGGAR